MILKHLLFNGIVEMAENKLMRNYRGPQVAVDGIMQSLHYSPAFKVPCSGVMKVSLAVHVDFILSEVPRCNFSLLWSGDSTHNK